MLALLFLLAVSCYVGMKTVCNGEVLEFMSGNTCTNPVMDVNTCVSYARSKKYLYGTSKTGNRCYMDTYSGTIEFTEKIDHPDANIFALCTIADESRRGVCTISDALFDTPHLRACFVTWIVSCYMFMDYFAISSISISLFITVVSLLTPDAELHSSLITMAFMFFGYENGLYIFRKRHVPCAVITLVYICLANALLLVANTDTTCDNMRIIEYAIVFLMACSTFHMIDDEKTPTETTTDEATYVELE